MEQDLFSSLAYPNVPGARANECSRAAAEEMKGRAETLRMAVLSLLKDAALTADECAAHLKESVLSIRPRAAELNKMGLIFNTGKKRVNASGAKATVWRAVARG
jgi:predicted Rossmann fold nucleotide-binding protein DprA/Smf involved in DNA uptake